MTFWGITGREAKQEVSCRLESGRCKDTVTIPEHSAWGRRQGVGIRLASPMVRGWLPLPFLPGRSRLWHLFTWLPCLVFNQDKQRKEICFPVCFC